MINTVAIIQARMSSTRLPGKILEKVGGKEVLKHVVSRLNYCKNINKVVVATTNNYQDDQLISWLTNNQLDFFRGNEDDVLDRYYQTAKQYDADFILRVTSDSPLIDPQLVDFIVKIALYNQYDYTSNSLLPTFPDGLDIECLSFFALQESWKKATTLNEREHVTPYIRLNPRAFKSANITNKKNYSAYCWAIDNPKDLDFVKQLHTKIDLTLIENFSYKKIIKILQKFPEIQAVNQQSVRDVKLVEQFPEIFNQSGFVNHDYLE
jgi:spore coat polysaccharide biosynthesis protein SpsF (cytidylyltransferase family)